MPKHLLSLANLTPDDLRGIIDRGLELKKDRQGNKSLAGKSVAMLFTKSSTRTRLAFEVGIQELGGHPIFLNPDSIQVGRGESLGDTAKVMARYVHGLVVRTYDQQDLVDLAQVSSIPVINALTDMFHPCQAIADFMTMQEAKGDLRDVKLAYVGDGNNVAHSLMLGAAMLGMHMTIATPMHYEPERTIIAKATEYLGQSEGAMDHTNDPREAVKDADIVYTDTWVSMGQEEEKHRRERDFRGYIVDAALMKHADPEAKVMHCLPAYRGKEISGEMMDGPRSLVWDQAENKLHAQKAVLTWALED